MVVESNSDSNILLRSEYWHWLMPSTHRSTICEKCLVYIGISRYTICPFCLCICISRYLYLYLYLYITVYHGIQLVNCLHTISIDIVIVVVIVFSSHQKILVAPSGRSFWTFAFFQQFFRFFLLLRFCCAGRNWVNWVDTKLDDDFMVTLIPKTLIFGHFSLFTD